ncbi:MAG: hypothetical protein NT038_07395 [Euryarchaeota archaeon]|nr:hypothetical protein [Euryarchaeota archaeon]
MGCKKKVIVDWADDTKNILMVFLVMSMWISTLTPLVLADETSISITFDPNGTVDIDVTPRSSAFGAILIGSWVNTTGSTFTLYNNGTVAMNTQIKSNATTDSTQLTLDTNGNPGADAYSLYTSGLDTNGYITAVYGGDFDTAIAAGGNKGFDLCLNMGSSLSSNFTLQTTTIYLQGTSI